MTYKDSFCFNCSSRVKSGNFYCVACKDLEKRGLLKKFPNMDGIAIERRIHSGYTEKKGCVFGKFCFIFKSKKGEISLISLNVGHFEDNPNWIWEIYSYDELFDGVERYDNFNYAVRRVRGLLK